MCGVEELGTECGGEVGIGGIGAVSFGMEVGEGGVVVAHAVVVVLGVFGVDVGFIGGGVGWDGVDAPVDKDTELGILPPLWGGAFVEGVPLGLVALGGGWQVGEEQGGSKQEQTDGVAPMGGVLGCGGDGGCWRVCVHGCSPVLMGGVAEIGIVPVSCGGVTGILGFAGRWR